MDTFTIMNAIFFPPRILSQWKCHHGIAFFPLVVYQATHGTQYLQNNNEIKLMKIALTYQALIQTWTPDTTN